MSKIDPDQERQRLATRYAAMSDLELRKVGRDPASLTEWARDAFSEELKKRGLEWKPEPRIAKPIADGEILTRLGIYPDRNSAGLIRDFLASRSIKAFFCEEEPSAEGDSTDSRDRKETQLLVRAKELMPAREALKEKQEAEAVAHQQSGEASEADRPVILRRYSEMPAAFVEKSVLEDAGIECYLQDENVVRMDWFWSNAMGGIKLIVREKDAKEAEKILSLGGSPERAGGESEAPKM
jgi:hypothetical protein